MIPYSERERERKRERKEGEEREHLGSSGVAHQP
jgi:hypothetical protein